MDIGSIVVGGILLLVAIFHFIDIIRLKEKSYIIKFLIFFFLGGMLLAYGITWVSIGELPITLTIIFGCIILAPLVAFIVGILIKLLFVMPIKHAIEQKNRALLITSIIMPIVLLVIIGSVVFIIVDCSNQSNDIEEFDQYDIKVIAEQEVEERLKAPSTAKFSNIEVTKTGSTWVVTGYVDAQNSFGAMIRNRFRVEIKDNGYPKYTVVSVEIY